MAVRRGALSLALVPLVLVLTLILGAPAASAVSLDNVTGGQSKLFVPLANVTALSKAGIITAPIGGAYITYTNEEGPAVVFPISGGAVESSTMLGTVNHPGGLSIRKLNPDFTVQKQLDVTELKIVNGITLVGNTLDLVPAPTADLVNATNSKDPASGVISYEADVQINLVNATVLNTYFSTDVFKGGMILGHLKSTIQTKKLLL